MLRHSSTPARVLPVLAREGDVDACGVRSAFARRVGHVRESFVWIACGPVYESFGVCV